MAIINKLGNIKIQSNVINNCLGKLHNYVSKFALIATLLLAVINISCAGTSSSGSISSSQPPTAMPPPQRAEVPVELSVELDSDGDGYANAYDIEYLDADFYVYGNGSGNAPYLIENIYQLQAIAGVDHTGVPLNQSVHTSFRWLYGSNKTAQLESDYFLANDLDASITSTWTSAQVNGTLSIAGFTPIGDCDTTLDCTGTGKHAYRGKFSGAANTLSNLHISRGARARLGLFGLVGSTAEISSISLVNAKVTGLESVGGLVGESFGQIYNVGVSGEVAGSLNVGLLAGENFGLISSSSASGNSYGEISTGGLSGFSSGRVEYSSADVFVSGGNIVGGFIAFNRGDIYDSWARGEVQGISGVGGFTGVNFPSSEITNSYFQGAVHGTEDVGGLVGVNNEDAIISSSQSSSITTGNFSIGGLIGFNQGDVFLSMAEGNVSGGNSVGGLVGQSSGVVSASSFTGKVSGNNQVGGLVGFASNNITHSYAIANIQGQDRIGGLVGEYNQLSGITASYAITDFHLQSADAGTSIGGLIGEHLLGTDSDSHWQGDDLGALSQGLGIGRLSAQQIRRCGYELMLLAADNLLCQGAFTSITWGQPITHGNLSASWYFADQNQPPTLLIR